MPTKKQVGKVESVPDPENPLAALADAAGLGGEDAAPAAEDAAPAAEPADAGVVVGGSAEHESLLASGYGMSVAEARQIIAERDSNPALWPWEVYRKAKALLQAFEAPQGTITSRRPGPMSGKVTI